MNKDSVIGVLCGGRSSEREVSLRSGNNCLAALHRKGYPNARLIDLQDQVLEALQGVEVAFLALHGQYGEDGCIQGLLEWLRIPYTGNRVGVSALTMNKDWTKRLLHSHGLPVLPWAMVESPTESVNLPFPVMVKPVGEGSSIGMTKVDSPDALPAAIETARRYAQAVMVEQFAVGTSITVGVIEVNGTPTVTPILAFKTKTDWYDLEAKYTPGLTEFVLPADFSAPLTQAIQQATLAAHKACGCTGVSRTDFVVSADGAFYILEINTIPGMTDLSDLPAQAAAMGMGYDELVEALLHTAR
jgi:D-alanine-D-alanine ligase